MKKLSKQEQIEVAKRCLCTPERYKETLDIKDLLEDENNIDAVIVTECVRGGERVIVDSHGEVLWANSSVKPKTYIEEYKKGRRTPVEHLINRKRI